MTEFETTVFNGKRKVHCVGKCGSARGLMGGGVVSIDLICAQIFRFLTMEYTLVKNHTMENKSSISLGGTTIILALFARENIFGQILCFSI